MSDWMIKIYIVILHSLCIVFVTAFYWALLCLDSVVEGDKVVKTAIDNFGRIGNTQYTVCVVVCACVRVYMVWY